MQLTTFDGTPKDTLPLKHCDGCDSLRSQQGGVQITSTKWRCAKCWLSRNRKR